MDRRSFIRTAAAGPVLVGLRVHARALPRVAIVVPNTPRSAITDTRYYKAFVRGLRERGLEEGRNIVIVRRSAEGQYDRLPNLVQEVIDASVDVIVTIGPGVGAAVRRTRTIPIVAVGTDGLVESGAVASLGRPGGNVTGSSGEVGGLALSTKRLQLLHEVTPKSSRVAVLGYSVREAASGDPSLELAALALGQRIVWAHARTSDDVKIAFATIKKERIHALYVEAVPVAYRHVRDIVNLAAKLELPTIYEFREAPENGGLMSYGSDLAELFAKAAGYVDRILKGAKPSDLPVEQPTKFDLVINTKTAKLLGIAIPQSLLARAELIQ